MGFWSTQPTEEERERRKAFEERLAEFERRHAEKRKTSQNATPEIFNLERRHRERREASSTSEDASAETPVEPCDEDGADCETEETKASTDEHGESPPDKSSH